MNNMSFFPAHNERESGKFVGLKLLLEQNVTGDALFSFLQQIKSLGIKNLLLHAPLSVIQRLFQEEIRLITLFQEFEISLFFLPDVTYFFSQNQAKTRKYLLQSLFCNVHYFKRNQILGHPLVHFWGQKPEIYELKNRTQLFSLRIPQPSDVDSLFLFIEKDGGNLADQLQEITTHFDKNSGQINTFKLPNSATALVVLRKYFFTKDSAIRFRFNYYDSASLAALQKQYKLILKSLPLLPRSIYYDLDQMFEINQQLNRVYYTPSFENVLHGVKKTIAYFFLKSPQNPDNFFLKIVFKRLFNSILRSRLEVISPRVHFQINADSPLLNVLSTDRHFLLTIDPQKFQFETPYFWETFAAIKQMASDTFSENQNEINVQIFPLLSSIFSITEQKFYFDILAQAGATRFWFNVKQISDITLPNSFLLSDQMNYMEQLANFLDKGIPQTNILVLVPSLDFVKTKYLESIETLAKTGLPFLLISFDRFLSAAHCKIENNTIVFNQKSFNLLLLPAISTISYKLMKKLSYYFKHGGHLATLCSLPERVEIKEKQPKFLKLKKQLWLTSDSGNSITFVQDESGGKSYFIPLLKELTTFLSFYQHKSTIYVEGKNVLLNIKETQNAFFVFVTNILQDQKNTFVLKSKKISPPFRWDFELKRQMPIHFWNIYADILEIPLQLAPWESQLIIIPKEKPLQREWHLAFCSTTPFSITASDERTFVLSLPQTHLGPIDLLFDNGQKQFSTTVMITEKQVPFMLPDDHWLLEINSQKKAIHLNDIEAYLNPEISTFTLQTSFLLKHFRPDFDYILDLGLLLTHCTIKVNGQNAGSRWFSPFVFNLTPHLRSGENKIEIILQRPESPATNFLNPMPSINLQHPLQITIFKKFVIQIHDD